MKKKFKQNKNLIIELFIIFLITLVYNLIFAELTHDEVWNYGFASNISNGLLPYKNFNMVLTPLYPFLGSIFLIIFGKNLVVFHIFNAIMCTIIFYLIKKLVPSGYYIVYAFLLLFSLPNYNLLCLLLLYLLMYMEDKKLNDYLIGIVLGLTFLTKQNIGIMLCVPTLFTKDIKRILKRIIGFSIPNIIFLIYLLITDSLYDFINYTILGLSSFASNNILISIWVTLTIIAIIYLIYVYFKHKDIKAIYLLSFQVMAFPIIDTYHVLIPFIPVLGYFLSNLKLVIKIIKIAFLIFIVTLFFTSSKEYIKDEIDYPNKTNFYSCRKLDKNTTEYIKLLSKYVSENKDNIFIISGNAYLLKLEANISINKYDLLNEGNLGKNGDIKIINEIKDFCNNNKCLFLISENEINNSLSQINKNIVNYVKNTYKETDKISIYTIYGNEE